jgi:aminopeptidase
VDDATLRQLAELAVRGGANVQPDQVVSVSCEPGKEHLARAVAAASYRAGARFVDVQWFDPWVKRARIAHARDDTLDYVPPWLGRRMLALGEQRAARILLAGPAAPDALAGLDPARAARDRLPAVSEGARVLEQRTTNWTIVPCPTRAWAALVFPDLSPADAQAELDRHLVHVLRLDEPDPVAAWGDRIDALAGHARRLTERGLDAIHLRGPGTDLTVGLLPAATWMTVRKETVDGVPHLANLPSEEVFTAPDQERVDGHVSATLPLVLPDGTIVRDLRVRFGAGRVTELTASTGQEVMRAIVATDDGAARLGELALVDGQGRIGSLNTVYYNTLLDENAASHIALGHGIPEVAGERLNRSAVHVDFMIGSPELEITGVTSEGARVPILRDGAFVL